MSDREILQQYLGGKCVRCGTSIESIKRKFGTTKNQFDFHHVNEIEKDPNYKNLIRRILSPKLLDEADKCILLCRNCHGLMHAQNFKATFTLSNPRWNAPHSVLCGGILDYVEGSVSLYTNERLKLTEYCVHADNSPHSKKVPFHDMHRAVSEYICNIDDIQRLQIHAVGDVQKVELFSMKSIGPQEAELSFDIKRFPFIDMEIDTIEGKKNQILVRNGFIIENRKEIGNEGRISATVKIHSNKNKIGLLQ